MPVYSSAQVGCCADGDIKRVVIHEAQLTDVDVANLYEPNCGKHLHGYYVEVTEPPAHVTTGGTGEVDGCTDWECYTLYFFTVVLFLIALMCCSSVPKIMSANLLSALPQPLGTFLQVLRNRGM